MSALLASLAAGGRILLLAPPYGSRARIAAPADEGPAVFFALCLADLLLGGLLASAVWPPPWRVSADGILSWLAQVALLLAASWALVRLARRERLLWPVAAWLAAALLLMQMAICAATWFLFFEMDPARAAHLVEIFDTAIVAWWFLLAWRLSHHLGARWPRALPAAIGTCLLIGVSWHWLPQHSPLSSAVTIDMAGTSGAGEAIVGFDAISPEQVLYAQPQHMEEALARLAPQRPGIVDLYVVAFAGDGTESVFRNEVEHVERLFSQRFGAVGRVLTLINHPATLETAPLATLTNLTWAIDGVAAAMDPEEDILLVFVTSHGSEAHDLLVDLPPLPLDAIGPEQLADALEASPRPRWRVVVVSACYSGGFLDALRDEGTLVITAARADRTSFGCGTDADITYFGRALFDEALNRTASLTDAFEMARETVAERERAEGIDPPSEPQIATAPAIEAQLARWQQRLEPGPAVPFAIGARSADAAARPTSAAAPGDRWPPRD
ncbi:MAG TPA: C13 family peptidase [Dokdonella sp.]|uniref:C13 family peptidase n=1 Tax=Dokdonella sp. TaxID=2291710 RepID=UPI002CE3D65E|nr:C13 family peptidase [Dokdonella sp.]HUD41800.1 C13 family peptidase [Dokdonella sp.]